MVSEGKYISLKQYLDAVKVSAPLRLCLQNVNKIIFIFITFEVLRNQCCVTLYTQKTNTDTYIFNFSF